MAVAEVPSPNVALYRSAISGSRTPASGSLQLAVSDHDALVVHVGMQTNHKTG
jgi:hypothetical protein